MQKKERDMKDREIMDKQTLCPDAREPAVEIDRGGGGFLRSFERDALKNKVKKKKKKPLLSDNMKLGLIIAGVFVLALCWLGKEFVKEPKGRRRSFR